MVRLLVSKPSPTPLSTPKGQFIHGSTEHIMPLNCEKHQYVIHSAFLLGYTSDNHPTPRGSTSTGTTLFITSAPTRSASRTKAESLPINNALSNSTTPDTPYTSQNWDQFSTLFETQTESQQEGFSQGNLHLNVAQGHWNSNYFIQMHLKYISYNCVIIFLKNNLTDNFFFNFFGLLFD